MSFTNTTASQDKEIAEAESANHIANLVAIIESLDSQITEWKSAASELRCSTPDQLRDKIRELEKSR
jgi:hypothetical protein